MLAGASIERLRKLQPEEQQDFNIILTATLTLLSLILGFSFSMAITRYDQRKGYEEAEANAISAEYSRTELLPPADAAKVQMLLRNIFSSASHFTKREIASTCRKSIKRRCAFRMNYGRR